MAKRLQAFIRPQELLKVTMERDGACAATLRSGLGAFRPSWKQAQRELTGAGAQANVSASLHACQRSATACSCASARKVCIQVDIESRLRTLICG